MEGTPEQMQKNMDMMIALPDDTKMFGGHEYTQANFQFGYSVEKDFNPKVVEFWEQVYKPILDQGYTCHPSLVGNEKIYNVFMRTRVKEVQAKIERNIQGGKKLPTDANSRAIQTMTLLRQWKSNKYQLKL